MGSGFGEFAFGVSPFGGPSFAGESPGVVETLPAYLFEEYADDENLQSFIDAYNTMTQQYIDWFNMISLPFYPGFLIAGPLLDWVGNGIYGVPRPYIILSGERFVGPYNTWVFNSIPFNFDGYIGPESAAAANDDIYKRTITWNFFKGDGAQFNIRWLKRRIMRFLYGGAGLNYNADQTYRISVTFGTSNEVTIRIVNGQRALTQSSLFDAFVFNSVPFDGYETEFVQYPPIPFTAELKAGILQGFLQTPFQWTFQVLI